MAPGPVYRSLDAALHHSPLPWDPPLTVSHRQENLVGGRDLFGNSMYPLRALLNSLQCRQLKAGAGTIEMFSPPSSSGNIINSLRLHRMAMIDIDILETVLRILPNL
ncbi:hypothetical protein CSOJ01_09909 [Colletotrichum sojae]|uniref:Uncharacterized protein n=1 Tax=Colletotrichum sojae TaxID=2175907 RepID=A0A8H6MQU9_9PEZI|nr:hypothetical protein CSOJ01_09909 [Colletotrichum sojae]